MPMPKAASKNFKPRGFKRTSDLLTGQIRNASETRGFAVSRILTHWEEIAGVDVAKIARPVDVSYGRGGMGATLSLLTTGAQAPMLEMQKEQIRARVNATYGYNAIARIRITQTHADGFAEGQASFEYRARPHPKRGPDEASIKDAARTAQSVGDEGLRSALETLGANVLSKSKRQKGPLT